MTLEDKIDTVKKEEVSLDQQVKEESKIPYGYIPVELSSGGKFNNPEIIHVRNFTSSDLLELASQSEDRTEEASIKLLSHLILEEEVDPGLFTDKEVIEIYLAIYANWWGDTLQGYTYPIEEEDITYLKETEQEEVLGKILDEVYVPEVDLPITSLVIQDISPEFKEPIVFSSPGKPTIAFRTSRIVDGVIARNYVANMFSREQEKFVKLERKLQKEQKFSIKDLTITEQQREEYKDFNSKKSLILIEVLQSCLILSYDNKTELTLEEKLDVVRTKLSTSMWSTLSGIINKYPYGIQPEVEIESPIMKKLVTRRFQFRPLDFIPTNVQRVSDEYTVSLG